MPGMVSYSHRPQSGQIMCYLNRTYHVLPTLSCFSHVNEAISALSLTDIASQGEAQGCADFAHSRRTQVGHAPPQSILRNGNRIV